MEEEDVGVEGEVESEDLGDCGEMENVSVSVFSKLGTFGN